MKTKKQEKKIEQALNKLEEIYNTIPDTVGCMKWINTPKAEGGCGGRCCKYQNPQVLYVEFIRTWRHVLSNWTEDQIANLIEASMRNYLSDKPTKGCVFWDKDTMLCKIHTKRPYNCFIYGITPEEEFKPRYERLKVLYQDRLDAVIMDQCDLIETEDKTKVTKSMTDNWWKQLVEVEESIGIDKSDIHDDKGGSYLTYHDHILLQVCNDSIMGQLQFLRVHGSKVEKETAVRGLISGLKNKIKKSLEKS